MPAKKPTKAKKKNSEETPKRKIGGKNGMNGKLTGPPWGQKPQPTPEQKRAGWAKKRSMREMMLATISESNLPPDVQVFVKEQRKIYTIGTEELTMEVMLHLKMAQRAFQDGDVGAYRALMERVFGKPKEIEVENKPQQRAKIDLGGFELEI